VTPLTGPIVIDPQRAADADMLDGAGGCLPGEDTQRRQLAGRTAQQLSSVQLVIRSSSDLGCSPPAMPCPATPTVDHRRRTVSGTNNVWTDAAAHIYTPCAGARRVSGAESASMSLGTAHTRAERILSSEAPSLRREEHRRRVPAAFTFVPPRSQMGTRKGNRQPPLRSIAL
jgi:hypothetical protein